MASHTPQIRCPPPLTPHTPQMRRPSPLTPDRTLSHETRCRTKRGAARNAMPQDGKPSMNPVQFISAERPVSPQSDPSHSAEQPVPLRRATRPPPQSDPSLSAEQPVPLRIATRLPPQSDPYPSAERPIPLRRATHPSPQSNPSLGAAKIKCDQLQGLAPKWRCLSLPLIPACSAPRFPSPHQQLIVLYRIINPKELASKTVPLETKPGVKHLEGVVSMARGTPTDSGGGSFFFMLGEARHLDLVYGAFGCVRVVGSFWDVGEGCLLHAGVQGRALRTWCTERCGACGWPFVGKAAPALTCLLVEMDVRTFIGPIGQPCGFSARKHGGRSELPHGSSARKHGGRFEPPHGSSARKHGGRFEPAHGSSARKHGDRFEPAHGSSARKHGGRFEHAPHKFSLPGGTDAASSACMPASRVAGLRCTLHKPSEP
eukprot:365842-Chlamydomonas_euryale.AAC.2